MENKMSLGKRFDNANEWTRYFICWAISFVVWTVLLGTVFTLGNDEPVNVLRLIVCTSIFSLIFGYVIWYPLYALKNSKQFYDELEILKKEEADAKTSDELNIVRDKVVELYRKKGMSVPGNHTSTAAGKLITRIDIRLEMETKTQKLIEKAKILKGEKVLHITPSSNGYEEVELVANQVSKKNQFAVIREGEKISMTGGMIFHDTPEIRAILDATPKDKQYELVKAFKIDPFIKFYLEEEY